MEKLFEKILDDDEKIIKVFKPHKTKFFVSVMLATTIPMLFFVIISVLMLVVPDELDLPKKYFWIPLLIFVVFELLVYLLSRIHYKNLFYAYTNKRIVIRSGIFGVDYKSLDMGMIGAVNVSVTLLDKILCKDTGSLTFGSMASPISAESGAYVYKFANIEKPYETCKEVKASIDMFKNQKK